MLIAVFLSAMLAVDVPTAAHEAVNAEVNGLTDGAGQLTEISPAASPA